MKNSSQFAVPVFRRSLFPLVLMAVFLFVLSLFPLARRTGAQNGQKLSAAPNSSSGVNTAAETKLTYPETKKGDQVDDYFGVKVPDPYRWLEDENSTETKAWVQAQNKVTFAYLDTIPYREKLKARLTQLVNYTRISAPFHRGDTYFFTKNDGLQNQSVYYVQKGLDGIPEVFLDPTKFP